MEILSECAALTVSQMGHIRFFLLKVAVEAD
jgi:hypothetical protein